MGALIKVLIADDHAIVRRGLKEILARELPDITCGEAKNAEEILAQVQAQAWDLMILDLGLPGRSGVDVLGDLQNLNANLRILVLSMYPEDQYGRRVLKAGAWGYMNKESAPDELIKAIRSLLAGRHYLSPRLAEQLASDLHGHGDVAVLDTLSDRELEILKLIAMGRTLSQVANELHLAITTVSTYRTRLLEKTKKATTADLIRYALENHLIN